MRIFNRLLAFVVAVALLGTAVIVIIEVITARSNSAPLIIHWPSIQHWGEHNTWKATSVEVACAITAAAGLLLLIPQLIRRKPSRLIMDPSKAALAIGEMPPLNDGTDAALTRKGLAVTVRNAVNDIDGITRSRVKVGRRRLRVKAQSSATPEATKQDVQPKAADAAQQRLDALGLEKALAIRVDVSTKRSSEGVQ